jgi:hypothetical protein
LAGTNFVVRLRTSQDAIARGLLRIYTSRRVEFVPSVHVLVQTLVLSIIVLLLLLQTELRRSLELAVGRPRLQAIEGA